MLDQLGIGIYIFIKSRNIHSHSEERLDEHVDIDTKFPYGFGMRQEMGRNCAFLCRIYVSLLGFVWIWDSGDKWKKKING